MKSWDAIIIGSGLGGLTAAAYLAAAGQRTLVLEQYDAIGGCTHVFQRKQRWQFEVGLHYLGDCAPGGEIPTILRGVGLEGRIEFIPLDPEGFDTIRYPGLTLRVPVGWDHYLDNLIAQFPAEERSLRRFIGVLEQIGRSIDRHRMSRTAALAVAWRAGSAGFWARRPLASLLDACELSPEARAVLSTQWLSYACPPTRAPVAVHAGFLHNYVGQGAFYPRGGGQVIAAYLAGVVYAHGGEVRTRARVARILVEGGRAAGVCLAGGETIRASVVVSGADLKRTYASLVGREHLPSRVARRVEALRMCNPWVNAYLGVDVDLRKWMPATNYFSTPAWTQPGEIVLDRRESDPDRARAEWLERATKQAGAFIHSSTAVDPDGPSSAPPGCSVLEVMMTVPPDAELWGADPDLSPSSSAYRKSGTYQGVKERITDLLVARAEFALPGISQHIVWREASTPLTHARYTHSTSGSAYGVELNTRQLFARPASHSALRGLFLAGAGTTWGPGVEGVMISGMKAAGAILGRDLSVEIRAGAVLGDASRFDGALADELTRRPARSRIG